MPTRAASAGSQGTLSFHGGSKPNKVTKPAVKSVAKGGKKEGLAAAVVEEIGERPAGAEDESTATARRQAPPADEEDGASEIARKQPEAVEGPQHEQARAISDTQIKRYWRAKEAQRLAPRVHQEDLTIYERVLREWDVSGQFGVSHPPPTREIR